MVHAIKPDTGELQWTFATRARIDSSPVIAGDRIYVGGKTGVVYALNRADGAAVWEYDTGEAIVTSPAVVDDHLVIGNDDGLVFCFSSKAE